MKLFQLVFILVLSNSLFGQNDINNPVLDWQKEDCKLDRFTNGEPILQAQTPKEWFDLSSQMKPCFMITKRGSYLYNYYAITDDRGIAPKGFRICNQNDFDLLLNSITKKYKLSDSDVLPVQYLMSYNYYIEYWDEKAGELTGKELKGINSLGFNAQMSGYIDYYGNWCGMGGDVDSGNKYSEILDINTEMPCSYWWIKNLDGTFSVLDIGYCSQDWIGEESSYGYKIVHEESENYTPRMGFSVRLVKDPVNEVDVKTDLKENQNAQLDDFQIQMKDDFEKLFIGDTWVITKLLRIPDFKADGKWLHIDYAASGQLFLINGEDQNIAAVNLANIVYSEGIISIKVNTSLEFKIVYPNGIITNEYGDKEWIIAGVSIIENGVEKYSGLIEKGPDGKIPSVSNWKGTQK